MTDLSFPIRVSEDGDRLEPSGIDPYELPWAQGAAATLPTRTKRKYPNGQTDLLDKLAALKAKRPVKAEAEAAPTWGPRHRPLGYDQLHGSPLPASGDPFDASDSRSDR